MLQPERNIHNEHASVSPALFIAESSRDSRVFRHAPRSLEISPDFYFRARERDPRDRTSRGFRFTAAAGPLSLFLSLAISLLVITLARYRRSPTVINALESK